MFGGSLLPVAINFPRDDCSFQSLISSNHMFLLRTSCSRPMRWFSFLSMVWCDSHPYVAVEKMVACISVDLRFRLTLQVLQMLPILLFASLAITSCLLISSVLLPSFVIFDPSPAGPCVLALLFLSKISQAIFWSSLHAIPLMYMLKMASFYFT